MSLPFEKRSSTLRKAIFISARPYSLVLYTIMGPCCSSSDGQVDAIMIATGLAEPSCPRLTPEIIDQRGLLRSLIIPSTSLSQPGTIG